jgi:hypothetical protein
MILVGVAVVSVLIAMAGLAGAATGELVPEAPVQAKIHYQGRLTDPGGRPLSGTYTMRFRVHDDPAIYSLLWDSGNVSVHVDHGLFNVELGVDPTGFDGQGLWLEMLVDGELLTPRQELLPVPYALSLRPGARIEGNSGGYTLETRNPTNGTALWASSFDGAGGYFEAKDGRPDVVLGGPGSEDDGELWSDPHKASSDIFLTSNDEVWIDLDEDDSENAAFIIFNGGNQQILRVDEETGWYGHWSGSESDVMIRTRDDVQVYLDATDDSVGVWRLLNTAGVEVIWGREDGDGYFKGDLTVSGAKPAVVQTESHGYRRLYCMESPELWFEDFGTGQLEDGQATVTIDPLFAETVNLDLNYHVYVTPISDEAVLLFVTAKTKIYFEVQGVTLDGSPSDASFDYRIVAKRLGYEDRRLDAWDPSSGADASSGPPIIPDLGDAPRVPGEASTFSLER